MNLVAILELMMAYTRRTGIQLSAPAMRFIVGGIDPRLLAEFDRLCDEIKAAL